MRVPRENSPCRHRRAHGTQAFRGSAPISKSPDAELAFEFPGHRGTFRGTLGDDKATISGFWIQPHGAAGDPRDPDGQGQTYASPLTLTRGAGGVWRGLVVPLRDNFTLYLRIFRDADGALIGAFRNPEMNFRAGAAQFHVTQMHGTVSFAADPAHPDKALSAIYDAQDATLKTRLPGLDQTLILKHATTAEASGFFPHSPDAPPYAYRAPQSTGDGWAVARAGDAGFDEGKLAALVQSIIAVDPAAKRPDLIDSLLIARHGKLVLDEYFEGNDRDTPHDLRSAGKTFSSVMLGALMHEGVSISPDTHLYPLVAGMGPFANPDPRKGQITLAQLMTHTSGLACDDNDDASPGNEDTLQSQRKERNWWKYTLDLPVVHDPGTRYAYCSGGMNLMGAALTTTAHESLPELFDRTIARPLGWGPYYWNVMPNGQGYLGGGSFVRPRDFLKLGQAYLDGGVWNGRRLIDASWVERSTHSYVAINPSTTGIGADQFSNFYVPAEDGYAWHLAGIACAGAGLSRLWRERKRRPAPDRRSGARPRGRFHGQQLSAGADLERLARPDHPYRDHPGDVRPRRSLAVRRTRGTLHTFRGNFACPLCVSGHWTAGGGVCVGSSLSRLC